MVKNQLGVEIGGDLLQLRDGVGIAGLAMAGDVDGRNAQTVIASGVLDRHGQTGDPAVFALHDYLSLLPDSGDFTTQPGLGGRFRPGFGRGRPDLADDGVDDGVGLERQQQASAAVAVPAGLVEPAVGDVQPHHAFRLNLGQCDAAIAPETDHDAEFVEHSGDAGSAAFGQHEQLRMLPVAAGEFEEPGAEAVLAVGGFLQQAIGAQGADDMGGVAARQPGPPDDFGEFQRGVVAEKLQRMNDFWQYFHAVSDGLISY
ncbi:hypothetical protein SDC9_67664 [bioreactor metagenome]|uniref:Uncharacterized protein n=1 Tax=bioreactor metagenome TaxID=1076179 RepID=A0A644XYA9_9ZZZZ